MNLSILVMAALTLACHAEGREAPLVRFYVENANAALGVAKGENLAQREGNR